MALFKGLSGTVKTEDIVFGHSSLEYTIVGKESRIIWDSLNSYFAAGNFTTETDSANRGQYSANFGLNNTAIGRESGCFGENNSVLGDWGLACGVGNTITNDEGFVCGDNNQVTGDRSAAFGLLNIASGTTSFVFGQNSVAQGEGSLAGGFFCLTPLLGEIGFGAGAFSVLGDNQCGFLQVWGITSDATPLVLELNGVNQDLLLSTNKTWYFDIRTIGRGITGSNADKSLVVQNQIAVRVDGSGTAAIIGTPPVQTIIGMDVGITWTVAITVGTSPDRLQVTVTGQASNAVFWSSTVFYRKVGG